MKHLERAHARAQEAGRAIEEHLEPSEHLAPAARRLERGLAAIYDAFDGRADRPSAIGAAHARLWEAAILTAKGGHGGALAALRDACSELVAAEERYPRVPVTGRAAAVLQAGAELPPLHTVERDSLAPSLRAPPVPEPKEDVPVVALPEPTTFEELAAVAKMARKLAQEAGKPKPKPEPEPKALPPGPVEPPPGFAVVPPPALSEDAFVRSWARHCFEEIGMLGVQRTPLPGDDWRASLAIERRMVTAIDAVAALGPVAVASLEPLAMDAPAANPMGVFAMAMLGGCLEGRDALAGAERVLYRFGAGDPAVYEPFASAMKLAPNPFIRSALRSIQASSELGCRPLAIEVLACRGWFEGEELAALADDEDPRILALVLPALAAARHPDLGRALSRALGHDDLALQEAALDAMVISAHPQAAQAARSAAAGALGDRALVRLALVASEEDARWLLDRANASPTPAAVEALGWAGLVDAVPALINLLGSEEKEVQLAAGAALDRLLGANLVQQIEIMPEALEEVEVVDPDPEPPPPRKPLAALVGDPRDPPPPGSAETLEVPSIDPEQWRAHWAEHGKSHDPRLRLRRGNPYSPSVSLYELDRLPLSPEDRRRLHRELAARTGKFTAFDPHDFVIAQEQSLAAWGALVKSSAETPGSWSRPTHR
jgi:hypothetical protein